MLLDALPPVPFAAPRSPQVILGGGRVYMAPRGTPDPEYPEDPAQNGTRRDGRDLVAEWLSTKQVPWRGRGAITIVGHGARAIAIASPLAARAPATSGTRRAWMQSMRTP